MFSQLSTCFRHGIPIQGVPSWLICSAVLFAVHSIAIPADAQKIYWLSIHGDTIERANPDGSNREILVSGLGDIGGLHVNRQPGQIFWSMSPVTSTFVIKSADLDGQQITDVHSEVGSGFLLDLFVDPVGARVYWTHNMPSPGTDVDEIRSVDLAGSGLEILMDGLETPDDIHVDTENGYLYWTEQNGQRIGRAELDGSNPVTIITTEASLGINSMAIDQANGLIYWTEPNSLLIRRANLDGTNPQTVLELSGDARPFGIALDGNGHMFWTELDTDRIRRATVGGQDITTVVSGTDGPRDVIFVPDVLTGDVNGDGVVDLLDVAPFVDVLVNGTHNPVADINGDGVVDLLDVGPFVELLSGG